MPRMKPASGPLAKIVFTGLIVGASFTLADGVANADTVNWDAIAQCESGGNWSADTGNGHYGGLQISPATWAANGGIGSPARASRQEQIAVADHILATQGIGAWPKCGANSGLPAGMPPSIVNVRTTVNHLISLLLPH